MEELFPASQKTLSLFAEPGNPVVRVIDTETARIARTHAFVAQGVSVEIRGRCADCAAKSC